MHDDALYKASGRGGSELCIVVEAHCTTVRHDPGTYGLLIGGEGNVLDGLIGTRLDTERPGGIRLQNGAVIDAPGRQYLDDFLGNRLELAFWLCLTVGFAY